MTKLDYHKSALTTEQQLDKLIQRGLTVENYDDAIQTLTSISYYRLSAYWYPFRTRDANGKMTSTIIAGTTFSQIITLYEFDRQLRSLILDAIERVEVATRTRLTYYMGHKYGSFVHVDPRNFHPTFNHAPWLRKLEGETSRSKDKFIEHYKNKYSGFPTVPIWMLTEVMSLGSLSLFYKGLQNSQKLGIEDKKAISLHFNIHHKRLEDWLHTLTYIRNICAHHGRLWNRELSIRPDESKDIEWLPPITPRNDRVFFILLMLRHLLREIGSGDQWSKEITSLLEPISSNTQFRLSMGIPTDWKDHPIWK